MSVKTWKDNNVVKEEYTGCVIDYEERYWMDGMIEETAIVWDETSRSIKNIQVGYYGNDGRNMCNTTFNIDCTTETARKVYRYFKERAVQGYCDSILKKKKSIEKGIKAEVIRGRKVKKGTVLNIFWVGERPTYQSRYNSWMNETELIAGCYDEEGNKVFIKAEYLKNITPWKAVKSNERKKIIKAYTTSKCPPSVIKKLV